MQENTLFGVLIATAAFIPVFFLLILLFYCYSVVGVYLFAGDENFYLPSDVEANSTFDQIHFAAITLYQVLTGQNWDTVMYVHLYTFGFGAAWYFLSFVVLFGLIYTQLVIGMVVDGYLDSVKEAEEDAKEKIVDKNAKGKDRKKQRKDRRQSKEKEEKENKEKSIQTPRRIIVEDIPEIPEEKEQSPGLELEHSEGPRDSVNDNSGGGGGGDVELVQQTGGGEVVAGGGGGKGDSEVTTEVQTSTV